MDNNFRIHTTVRIRENEINETVIHRYDASGLLISQIIVSGNANETLDEVKLFYKNGLLSGYESGEYLLNYEYDGDNRITKYNRIHKTREDRRTYGFFKYNGGRKIKQCQYWYDRLMNETMFEYDHAGRRIAVFANNELLGFREYGGNGQVKKFHYMNGETLLFSWENKYSNYDYDMTFGI